MSLAQWGARWLQWQWQWEWVPAHMAAIMELAGDFWQALAWAVVAHGGGRSSAGLGADAHGSHHRACRLSRWQRQREHRLGVSRRWRLRRKAIQLGDVSFSHGETAVYAYNSLWNQDSLLGTVTNSLLRKSRTVSCLSSEKGRVLELWRERACFSRGETMYFALELPCPDLGGKCQNGGI